MKVFIILFALFILLPSIGCVTGLPVFPVQQTGTITSYPSGADLYLIEEYGTKDSHIGKTPLQVSLVSHKVFQWKIKAVLKDYEPQLWFVHGGKNIDHHFAFTDEEQFRKKQEEDRLKKEEEERLKKELMEKLKAKRDQFLQYGFDVLDFVGYAKATLKVRGEINFGGAVPEINFRTFKNKSYVEVKINYLVTYNTLKVSMYDAASMTFDEIVKKLAKKISTDFKRQETIEGFIFSVTYTNRDFSEKYDMPRDVANEFILPKDACREYAALDLTNQELINKSIVLVDGERISLNLQISR